MENKMYMYDEFIEMLRNAPDEDKIHSTRLLLDEEESLTASQKKLVEAAIWFGFEQGRLEFKGK